MDFVEKDQVAGEAVLTHWYYRAKFSLLRRTLVRAGLFHTTTSVADIGCGLGVFLTLLQRQAAIDAARLVGCDPMAPDGQTSINGSIPIVRALPDGQQFDLILLMDVLEHIEKDREFLSGTIEKIRPGGYAFITVPAFQGLWSRHDELLGHYRRYSIGTLRALIAYCPSLRIEKLHYFYAAVLPPAAVVRWLRRGATDSSTDMAPCNPLLNEILASVLKAEAIVAALNKVAGLSVVALCRKTD